MKKIISIILTIVMLLSICPNVLAALPQDASNVTTTSGFATSTDASHTGAKWTDDFEMASNLNEGTYKSSLYENGATSTFGIFEFVGGKTGNGLKITSASTTNAGTTDLRPNNAGTLTDDAKKDKYGKIFSTYFKVGGTPEDNTLTEGYGLAYLSMPDQMFSIEYSATGYIMHNELKDKKSFDIDKTKWYRLIDITFDKTTRKCYILDEDGTILDTSIRSTWSGGYQNTYPIYFRKQSKGLSITLDNSEYTLFWKDKFAPTVAAMPGTPTTNVPVSTKSIEITSDQPIIQETIEMTGGAEAINCTIAEPERFTANNEFIYKISWTEDLIQGNTYTFDFSSLTNNVSNHATGTFSFATKAETIEDSIVVDVNFDGEDDNFDESGRWYDTPKNDLNGNDTGLATYNWYSSYDGTPGRSQNKYLKDDAGGYKSSVGLKLGLQAYENTSEQRPAYLLTKDAYDVSESKSIVATYRFNVKTNAADQEALISATALNQYNAVGSADALMKIIGNETNGYLFSTIDDSYKYSTGHWYNIILTAGGGKEAVTVVDEETGIAVLSSERAIQGDATEVPVTFMHIYADKNKNEGCAITVDDIKVYYIDTAKDCNKLVADASAAASNGVSLTFNQPIIIDDSPVLTRGEGEACNVTANLKPTITYPDFNKAVLTYNDALPSVKYTVGYGSIKSAAGMPCADTTLTAEFTAAADSSYPVYVEGNAISTGNKTGKTITFTMYNPDAITGADVLVALFNGSDELLGVESTAVSGQNAGVIQDNVTVTLTNDYDSVSYAKLFIWNSKTGLKPMSKLKLVTIPIIQE